MSSSSTSSLSNDRRRAAPRSRASRSASSLLELRGSRRSAARRRAGGRPRARRARPRACACSSCSLSVADRRRSASFSACQLGLHRVRSCSRSSASSRSIASRRATRRVVGLLRERLALDLELHDAPLDLVDLGRHRVDLDAQPRGGLVDQVDRLVGQEAVGDVAVREHRRGHQRRVLDADAVVDLVALLEPAQDRDRVLDGRLVRRTPAGSAARAPRPSRCACGTRRAWSRRRAQLAARERRLEQVGGVDRALGGARADDRVQLVDEQDDLALGLLDLLQHRLEAVLELAAVLGARDQRADVERDHAAVAQRLGHVARHDALGQALDDRGLADARARRSAPGCSWCAATAPG